MDIDVTNLILHILNSTEAPAAFDSSLEIGSAVLPCYVVFSL